MIRNLTLFAATFVAGALIALAARAAWFNPHSDAPADPVAGGDYAPMVTNPLTPNASSAPSLPAPTVAAATTPASGAPSASANPHAHHGSAAPAAPAPVPEVAASAPVNTVCAICGMDVDPKLPTSVYQGKTIGFGCKMCPPKFKADPDRYGPYYLRNEVIKR
jgi:YHS domain-containing protein